MNHVKMIRERLGVTQAVFAAGIGCSQGNVAHYENRGQTMPPEVARRLIAYAATLGHAVTYDDVYGPVPEAVGSNPEQSAVQGVVNA